MLNRVTRESFISSAGQTGAGVLVAVVTLDTIPGPVLLRWVGLIQLLSSN